MLARHLMAFFIEMMIKPIMMHGNMWATGMVSPSLFKGGFRTFADFLHSCQDAMLHIRSWNSKWLWGKSEIGSKATWLGHGGTTKSLNIWNTSWNFQNSRILSLLCWWMQRMYVIQSTPSTLFTCQSCLQRNMLFIQIQWQRLRIKSFQGQLQSHHVCSVKTVNTVCTAALTLWGKSLEERWKYVKEKRWLS